MRNGEMCRPHFHLIQNMKRLFPYLSLFSLCRCVDISIKNMKYGETRAYFIIYLTIYFVCRLVLNLPALLLSSLPWGSVLSLCRFVYRTIFVSVYMSFGQSGCLSPCKSHIPHFYNQQIARTYYPAIKCNCLFINFCYSAPDNPNHLKF